MRKNKLLKAIEIVKAGSAWDKGVKLYAYELVEELEVEEVPSTHPELKAALLNGAENWGNFSWGGSSLIYNCEIAERLCTKTELKRTKGGELAPNKREEWLDVQARALTQACNLIATLNK